MATKRSFSEKVTGSDAFAELSFEAQALYLQLSMSADDEGVVSAPKKVQKSIGASIDALDELEAAGYLVFFDSGACVIAHWNQNNYINQKRKKATEHAEEVSQLYLDEDGVYHEIEEIEESAASEKHSNSVKNPVAERDASKLPANYLQTTGKLPVNYLQNPCPPLFSPFFPLSSFPQTPIYYTPYNPPHNTSTPQSSSSSMFSARAQEFSLEYWGRKLKKYEKAELRALSLDLAEEREGTEAGELCLSDEDIKLLRIAFSISADAGVCNLTYLRGIYERWHDNGIHTASAYFKSEIKRGTSFGIVSRKIHLAVAKGEPTC